MNKRKKYKCNACGHLFNEIVWWIGASEDRRTIDRIRGCPMCDYRDVMLNKKEKEFEPEIVIESFNIQGL